MKKKKTIDKIDLESWEEFTKNPKNIFDKDSDTNQIYQHKRFRFDLHGFTLSEANEKVKELIHFCYKEKYKEILLITGKGLHSGTDNNVYASKDLSKLRYSIPHFINLNSDLQKLVNSILPAKKEQGGDGALVIKLK